MRFALLLPALAALGCATPPTQATTDGVDAGVRGLLKEWAAAGEQSRNADLKALYAEDPQFYWAEQGRVAYESHAAVIAGVDQAAGMNATIRNEVSDIDVTALSADAAAFRANAKIAVASDAFSFEFDGVFTGVAIKRAGSWRFLNGHLSAPR